MYVSHKQLSNYLSLPKASLTQLAQQLTSLGLESEAFKEGLKFTPLPNRPDLFSARGICQEISILLNCSFHLSLAKERKSEENWIKLAVESSKCREIHLALVKNVKIKPSPEWIKDYLEFNNLRSLNNLVDIGNLIMLETGQPFHIYDYDSLPKQEIIVRSAQEGEKLRILTGTEVILNKEDLIVASGEKVISLAGIIGGQATAIKENTTNILIEIANFDLQAIKQTTKRLNISTQASQSFQKGTNLFGVKESLWRAIDLIDELHSVELEAKIISLKAENSEKKKAINISHEFIEKKIGIKLTPERLAEIWKRLGLVHQKEEKQES